MTRFAYVSAEELTELNGRRPEHTDPLLKAEVAVMRLAAQGLEANAIAGAMKISFTTATNHINRVKKKFGVQTLAEAIAASRTMGAL